MVNVDILMATYNGSAYITQQIDSIITQTHSDWRLLIRDDGSRDNTVDIIRQYASQDSRIILIEDSLGNLGVSCNFATLLNACQSQYTMFADQDDVWFDDKIEASLNCLQNLEKTNPDKGALVFANSIITNTDLSIKYGTLYRSKQKYQLKDFLFANAGYQGAAMIFNAQLRDILLPLPDIRVHDYYISLVGHLQGVVGYLPAPKAYYRRHHSSVNPNNKTLGRRIQSFIAGNPILFYPDMHSCLDNYASRHQISPYDKTLIEAYFYITATYNSLIRRICKAIKYRFTLRNNMWYLIVKLLIIRK